MRFALLGADEESLQLTEVAMAAGHQLVWCGDVGVAVRGGTADHLLAADYLQEDQAEQWEVLFDPHFCDAAILGQGCSAPAMRAEQLGQLSKNGIAVLATFPLVESVLSFYEIDMARSESGAVLHHFNPLVQQQPILEQLCAWVRDGHPHLGAVEQIVWERPLGDRSRERVLWHFARDVELLDLVAGRLDRLGALGSPNEEVTYRGLSVQLLGASQVPVRWSLGPVQQSDAPRLILVAQQGKVTAEFSSVGQTTQLETLQEGTTRSMTVNSTPAASVALEHFVAAVETGDSASSTWPSALRAMELTDTIEISLRRGRMIDVHPQQLTEELAFKGAMSALGCGVLIAVVPLLLSIGWLAEQIGIPVAGYWPHVLFALLALFLVLQLVPKLLMSASNSGGSASSDRSDRNATGSPTD